MAGIWGLGFMNSPEIGSIGNVIAGVGRENFDTTFRREKKKQWLYVIYCITGEPEQAKHAKCFSFI
jgi:hypothetical protein